MTDETRLLRAILAEPFEDTPRLMYADEIEARGERERAEFIRVQCELARFATFDPDHRREFNELARGRLAKRMTRLERGESESLKFARAIEEGGRLYDQRRDYLRGRERELWASCGESWVRPLPGWPITRNAPGRCRTHWGTHTGQDINQTISGEWSRGFVSEIRCRLAVLLGHECRECAGPDDGAFAVNDRRRCAACDGARRTTGVAAELFRAHPILGVAATGVRPGLSERDGWYWEEEHGEWTAANGDFWAVPGEVAGNLEGYIWARSRSANYPSRQRFYPTAEAANLALSRALVSLGRSRAGLPPITGWVD